MLSMILGECNEPNYVETPAREFRMVYEDEWLEDELVKQMVLAVDKSKVISSKNIESPVFGSMSPDYLSGGVKTLILIYKMPEYIFNFNACGENCIEWLIEIGRRVDVTVRLGYCPDYEFDKLKPFSIRIKNDDSIVESDSELTDALLKAGVQ